MATDPPRTSARAASARARFLEAGAGIFSSFRPEDVLPGVRSVCREAGLPTGSFYNCFASATDFHRQLVAWLGEHDETAEVSDRTSRELVGLSSLVATAEPDAAAVVGAIAAAAGADAERMVADAGASARAQYLLSSLAEGDGEVASDIRQHYGQLYQHLAANQLAGMAALQEATGVAIRAPFTLESVGLLITALTDGFVLRSKLDPALDIVTLIEDATRALLVALVVHPGDDQDLDDRTADVFAAAATRGLSGT